MTHCWEVVIVVVKGKSAKAAKLPTECSLFAFFAQDTRRSKSEEVGYGSIDLYTRYITHIFELLEGPIPCEPSASPHVFLFLC